MPISLINKHRFAGSLIYGDRYFVYGQIYPMLLGGLRYFFAYVDLGHDSVRRAARSFLSGFLGTVLRA